MLSEGFYQRTNKIIDDITLYLKDIYDSNNQEEARKTVGKIQDELVTLENNIYDFFINTKDYV